MVITLCSLLVEILFIILLIIGLLNLELHIVHTLVFEEIDSLAKSQMLNKASMSTKSHLIVVSYLRIGVLTRMLSNSMATLDPSVSHSTCTHPCL